MSNPSKPPESCANCSGSGVVIQREHDDSEDSIVRACSWCEHFESDSAAIDHILELLEREAAARQAATAPLTPS